MTALLIEWYFFNKRDFPWRTQVYSDPQLWIYQTWVCEVMSQQTLISVVLPKFEKFITELPDLSALAHCSDELLRYLWSGLGYYARARNLRNGAKFILQEYHGSFPKTQKEWLTVPGCGLYTSSIIASICLSEIVPAIDGNVIRVASRLLGLKNEVWEKSGQRKIFQFMTETMQHYFSSKSPSMNVTPGDFNQAFMELGAIVCKKSNPLCELCPLQKTCVAYKQNIVALCPPIKPRKQTQEEQVEALVIINKKTNSFLLVEREVGFLAKTTGFPLFAKKNDFSLNSLLKKINNPCSLNDYCQLKRFQNPFYHQITHHKITGYVTLLEGYFDEEKKLELYEKFSLPKSKYWVPIENLKQHLSSSLDQKVVKTLS